MIKRLTIENFLSFRGEHQLSFPKRGLVVISGRNELSAAANSNGAGKTSILNAINWGFFGEPLRGGKQTKVACRHVSEPCRVTIEGVSPAGPYKIQRGQRPNFTTLTAGGHELHNQDAALDVIEKLLGFKANGFKAGAIFSPAVEAFAKFATADHAEKIRILDEMNAYDFSVWEKNAKTLLRDATQKSASTHADLVNFEAEAASVEQSLGVHAQSKARWTEAKAVEVGKREAVLGAKKAELEALGKAQELLRTYQVDLEVLGDYLREAEELSVATQNTKYGIEVQTSVLERAELRLRNLKKNLAKGVCPMCTQSVPAATLKRLQTKMEGEIEELNLTLQKAYEDQTKQSAQVRSCFDKAKATLGDRSPNIELKHSLIRECGRLEEQVKSGATIKDAIQQMKKDLAKLIASEWDGATLEQELKAKLAAAKTKQRKAQALLDKYARHESLLKYWASAFGDRGIRIDLLKDSSTYFSEQLSKHLSALSCGEAEAKVAFEVSRGRDTLITQPIWEWGADSYDLSSNGQDRRFDLAVFAALQDLAESRTVSGFPIRAFDEPSDALDDKGKEALAAWIGEQAEQATRPVLVITHSAEFGGMLPVPDASWVVVLDENGSRVEVE